MDSPPFCDTNVLLYALTSDLSKRRMALQILWAGPVISVQVLNEAASVARRKMKLERDVVDEFLEVLVSKCSVVPVTLEVHVKARDIAEKSKISQYDACIVAAAAVAGCSVLYSEDLNAGQVIAGVEVRNPFAGAL